MASPDFEIESVIDPINSWLQQGSHCLELWLACGVATPTSAAKSALHDWLSAAETAGFEKIRAHAQCLLLAETSTDQKADVLLDLMVWLQSLQRIYTAKQLCFHYSSE